jgi:hypothetical protein
LLYLKLKNVSKDLAFYPMDRYFTRYWRPPGTSNSNNRWIDRYEPYTYLQVGSSKFYGGPAGYYDLKRDPRNDRKHPNEYIVGQEDFDRELKPGEDMEVFICTDPEDDDLQKALASYKGKLTWRVQVRRGAVEVSGRRIPCTTVIGVEFKDTDYNKDAG